MSTATTKKQSSDAAAKARGEGKGSAKQDPTTKYPKPPFKFVQQERPGLASKMDPKPDHGETSYVGSGRLKGRPGQSVELAGIYVQLAAEDGSYANGQVYGAAGGSGQP